jgi:hypothetical protein
MNKRVLYGVVIVAVLGIAGWQTAGLLPSAITGMITAGSNVTITGSGTLASPYAIAATAGGGGVSSVTGTSPIISSGGSTPAISCPTCGVNITAQLTGTNCTITGNQCVAGSTTATMGVSGIPAGYRTLLIYFTTQVSTSAAQCLYLQYNGDTAAHYSTQSLTANLTVVSASHTESGATPVIGCASGTANTNLPGSFEASVDLYSGTTFTKNTFLRSMRWSSASFGQGASQSDAQNWNSTAAITSLLFGVSGANFQVGSSLSIYGIP